MQIDEAESVGQEVGQVRVWGEEKKAEPTLGEHQLRADQRERTE